MPNRTGNNESTKSIPDFSTASGDGPATEGIVELFRTCRNVPSIEYRDLPYNAFLNTGNCDNVVYFFDILQFEG